MMSGKYILDTNIVIALFDQEKEIIELIQNAEQVYVPAIVIGELYFGAYNSSKQIENVERIKNFRSDVEILNCDGDTGDYYGKIKKQLKDAGKPIPENDIWIGALAMQYSFTLVTRDKHLLNINDIEILNV